MTLSALFPRLPVRLALVLLVAFASCSCATEGRSDGFMSVCDLTPRYHDFASPPLLLPNGYFGGNSTGQWWTYQMNWAKMATAHSAYTLRAGDGASSADATTYVPGQPMDIHLRVADVRKQFIGLLMYATNSTGLLLGGQKIGLKAQSQREQHVGTWQVRQSDPYLLPNTCDPAYAPTGSTVTHSDADVKPVHAKFTWTGVAGGGTVRFRVLIKWDGQNRGSFYWPAQELVLREGRAPPPFAGSQQTVVGARGSACAEVCYKQTPKTPYCHAQAMMDIQSPAALDTALGPGLGLNTPSLGGCAYAGAPQVRADGYAQYRSRNIAATCPAAIQARPPTRMPDVCYTAVKADAKPICICTADALQQTRNPFDISLQTAAAPAAAASATRVAVVAGQKTSGAAGKSSASAALVAALALAAATFASGSARASRTPLLLLLLSVCLCAVLLPAPVQGHNWIQSQHRAAVASVNKPCQARIGRQPHVQVIKGQDFEVEWTGGHGDMANVSPFMFAVVHEANYSQLAAKNITAIMRDYVALAPASAHYESNPYYQRHHIHYSKVPSGLPECYVLANGLNRCGDYWREPLINASHPDYIVRDVMYQQTARKYRDGNGFVVTQQRFKPEFIANDVRVSYYSTVYPWLESVSIFPHPYIGDTGVFTSQSDIARFKVDARSGPGSFILYFSWSSYSDCVDIDVHQGPAKIENRYGSDAAAAGQLGEIVRLDHCEFRYVQQAASACRRMNSSLDATACVNSCTNKNRCLIQIVRANNLPTSMPLPVNIPYTVQQDASKNPLCVAPSVVGRVDAGCQPNPALAASKTCLASDLGALKADDYVCYEATVWKDQDTGVEEDFKLAKDPADPAWYSSCVFAKPAAGFLGLSPAPYEEPPWQVAEKCVDCGFQRGLRSVATSQQPDWGVSLNPLCPDCDVRNSEASISVAAMVGADRSNIGAPYVPRPVSSSSTAAAAPSSSSSSSSSSTAAAAPSSSSSSSTGGGAPPADSTSSTGSDDASSGSDDASSTASDNASSSSAGTSSTGSSTPTPAPATGTAQLVSVKFDLQVSDVSSVWMRSLLTLLSAQLGVDAKRLYIVSVASGSAIVTFAIAPPLSADSSEPSAANAAESFKAQYANAASPLRSNPLMAAASTEAAPVNTVASACKDKQVRESCGSENGDSEESASSSSGKKLPVWAWGLIIAGGAVAFMFVVSLVIVCRRRTAGAAALKRMTSLHYAASGESELTSNPASQW